MSSSEKLDMLRRYWECEMNKDLDFLIAQWNKIREKTLKSTAPTLIYEEGNLIKRTVRDFYFDWDGKTVKIEEDGEKIRNPIKLPPRI